MIARLAALACLCAGAPAALHGQAVTPVAGLTAQQAVLFTLRSAVRAQEAYHLDNTHYATEASKLRFTAEQGVVVKVLLATQRGWVGEAWHPSKPGRTCVVFFGWVDPGYKVITEFEGRRPRREGEPACDTF